MNLLFHGIYWPAFLMAAKLEPPRTVLCHSHWTVDGEKMSKSKGNVVCPFDRSQLYTSDGLRYFLLREGVAHNDGNYSDTKIVRILNAELADTLGNLLSRCCGMALNPNQTFPKIESSSFDYIAGLDVSSKLISSVVDLQATCCEHYANFNFYKVVDSVVGTLHKANLFFETMKPWDMRKANKFNELNAVLHVTMETLRVSGILLQPIVPNLTQILLDKLNVPVNERYLSNLNILSWQKADFQDRPLCESKSVLFKRMKVDEKIMSNS